MTDYLPLAQQIQILFDAVTHPDGRPFTIREVSDEIDVSLAAISQMRSGRIKNPQLNTLRELCRFFDVPLRYFEARTVEDCYAVLADARTDIQPQVSEITFRATQLSPAAQQDVLTLIKWVQAAEQHYQADDSLPPLPRLDAFHDN